MTLTGQQCFKFVNDCVEINPKTMKKPRGYTGLYGFHKYWGKKPYEPIAYIIEQLTEKGQLVVDPFVGSGITARESILRSRYFIGYDINSIATELTKLLIHTPCVEELKKAHKQIVLKTKEKIFESYLLKDETKIATHYLWEGDVITSVWIINGKKRNELKPTVSDITLSASFVDYKSHRVRPPRFFTNSRINSETSLTLSDIMTGRAQRNLDILIDAINECSSEIRPALKLCLTAASGQMTKMVFAVTGRGKMNGEKASKTEVGSWVIGYWRPKTHFEVNVWNCFERRLKRLISILKYGDPLSSTIVAKDIGEVLTGSAHAYLKRGDCRKLMSEIPENSAHLVITDPPHSDRVPYLELSEFWNSILGYKSDFSREIVISNAKERQKTKTSYSKAMVDFFNGVPRILKKDGYLVVLFNTSKTEEWNIFKPWFLARDSESNLPLRYLGHFPCSYSAGSVVQDNRKGSLKSDYGLVFDRSDKKTQVEKHILALSKISGWSTEPPSLFKGDKI